MYLIVIVQILFPIDSNIHTVTSKTNKKGKLHQWSFCCCSFIIFIFNRSLKNMFIFHFLQLNKTDLTNKHKTLVLIQKYVTNITSFCFKYCMKFITMYMFVQFIYFYLIYNYLAASNSKMFRLIYVRWIIRHAKMSDFQTKKNNSKFWQIFMTNSRNLSKKYTSLSFDKKFFLTHNPGLEIAINLNK